jgi:predicted DNA-binding protein with PD1-like motif
VRRAQPAARGLAPGLKAQELGATGKVWKVTMGTNDEVVSGLAEFAEKNKITSAYVTGVGGFINATFGWTDPQVRAFKKIEVNEKVEVSSFTGNITTENGQVQVHFHVLVTGSDGIAKGGHLIEAHVNPTMELYVVEAPPSQQKR